MRIIGGKYKGRRLQAPKNLPARPTTDFAKEALFSSLEHQIDFEESRMLDLCCGLGSISLEASSRGMKSVTGVDIHGATLRWLRGVLEMLDDQSIKLVRSDVIKFLKKSVEKYDLIFSDPPYEYEHYDELIKLSLETIQQEGVFILEHRSKIRFDDHPNFTDHKSYGEVSFTFFRK